MPAYFSYLPDIYVGTGANSDRQQEYTIVKNIFRRVKAREDLAKYTEFFEQVSIEDGQRPDQIAETFYGDPELDWVILLTNNITDVYTQWPKSRRELEYFTKEKYDVLDGIHHYETNEIKWGDRVVVEEGTWVDESFSYRKPDGVVISSSSHSLYFDKRAGELAYPEGGVRPSIKSRRAKVVRRELPTLRKKHTPNFVPFFQAKSQRHPSARDAVDASVTANYSLTRRRAAWRRHL